MLIQVVSIGFAIWTAGRKNNLEKSKRKKAFIKWQAFCWIFWIKLTYTAAVLHVEMNIIYPYVLFIILQ